jgi:hypothetical protein
MKGDFTRDTFDPVKHYQQVRMQQGRAQIDADWNEQAALAARREETTTADLLGHCGGPADDAAFAVFTDATQLTADEKGHLRDLQVNPPLATGDFFVSAGRYYVDGIQCENEWAVPYSAQPDRLDVPKLAKGRSYLLYLDVWQRHLTALEDGQIREAALGGPDTGTRVKTVWQARVLDLGVVDPNDPCRSGAADFNTLFDPGTAKLTADTAKEQAQTDPCVVPPGAGYTGLENQLYRVEIHEAGTALDAANDAGSTDITLPGADDPANQITVKTAGWTTGCAVEIYPSKAGSPKMKGQLVWITAVKNKVLTLNVPVSGFVDDEAPRLRLIYDPAAAPGSARATWKWSRENGSVTTRIEKIDGNKITVSSLGPDKNLGFVKDAWVELLDDALELDGEPGQLAQVDDVDAATRVITLKTDAAKLAANADGVLPERHPKLRRWEGVGAVKCAAKPDDNWLVLENGVQVRFASDGDYRTGHFWQIPARTATAQSPTGDIEWPVDETDRVALPPRGIAHHFCRLGIVTVKNDGSIGATDCRCLYPALTFVPRLFYVSGDGQEVMPDLTAPNRFYTLPQPLIAGVSNAQCLDQPLTVRFTVTAGNGRVVAAGGAPAAGSVDIATDPDGLARGDFYLDGTNWSQQVTATLLDANGQPVSLPLMFNANLSLASQVAYDPGACGGLQEQKTVQDALSRLAAMVSLYKLSGDGQEGATGDTLPQPVVVLAANRCGAAAGLEVTFRVISGGGIASVARAPTSAVNPVGLASCEWTLGPGAGTQELEAALVSNDPMRPVTEPSTVRFTALSAEKVNDPAPVRIVDVQLLAKNVPLPNESRLVPRDLREGIALLCDRMLDADTVLDSVQIADGLITRGQPTCFVTAEIPYPSTAAEISDITQLQMDPSRLIGYRPIVLHAGVSVERLDDHAEPGSGEPVSRIKWQPDEMAVMFLEAVLSRLAHFKPLRPSAVLLRLTLKGNFIWSDEARNRFKKETPGGFLDGDSFRSPEHTGVILPSGDKRRGGDFEMWFWLKAEIPPIKIKAEEKPADPKLSDKVDHKPVADVKVAEHLSAPGARSARPGNRLGRTKSAGKAFIRKEERPVMDPGTRKRK